MTAEVGLLNKTAVALAADSAVTISSGSNRKIYQSANELFMLSKFHPVGIMIYGNANFMDISWETIIKIYRDHLGTTEKPTLEDYAADFLQFIENNHELFPEIQQQRYVRIFIHRLFESMKYLILEKFEEKDTGDEDVLKEIFDEIIDHFYKDYQGRESLERIKGKAITSAAVNSYKKKYLNLVEETKKIVFEKYSISSENNKKLESIAIQFLYKNIFPSHSGIVIAGYGNVDVFPKLNSYIIEGISNNILKFKKDRIISIDFSNTASVVPFAQSEMVYTFMEGIDPAYQNLFEKNVGLLLNMYSEMFVDFLKKNTTLDDKIIKKQLLDKNDQIIEKFINNLTKYRRQNYTDSIVGIVSVLPKDELAAMAESLVNLTSFKRRVSSDDETVGGPIDVAVISKGDGLVWIKRKHYFESELNHHFFANYYRGCYE
jgi:hypothetical protein